MFLSPVSFTISIPYPPIILLFLSLSCTFSPPFPTSLSLVISNFQSIAVPKGSSAPFDHPLASTSELMQQDHLPQLTQRLQRGQEESCLPGQARWGLTLSWRLKQRVSVCQSGDTGKKTWCQPNAALFLFPLLKQPVGKGACHCSALVYWPLWVLVRAHHTQHWLSLMIGWYVCVWQRRFITAYQPDRQKNAHRGRGAVRNK